MAKLWKLPASRLGVMSVLVLCGLMLVTSIRLSAGTELRSEDTDFADLIRGQSQQANELSAEIGDLQAEVDALTAKEAVRDDDVATAQQQSAELETASGLSDASGPGLTVTLDDAPRERAQPDGVSPNDLVIHQQDVQSVVNALWAGGAEAVSIQGQRLITTSAVRCVGNTLRLNGRVYSPPYKISAVGSQGSLRSALDASREIDIYLQYVDLVGLGWSVQNHSDLKMQPYEGGLELRYAKVAG
ncbi:DUF881 domain-containing protein [Saxibacter everestensis]|uniref:DUF881 domain-containing protein n=1 Tax=Saxibacter everestensis TaxID=2909229 RepID=A0ABY8QRY0_9MICO|nr:DUF881 domain-containing protein [Brevibacteriaceae bacterium ZFBP1038]